MLGMLGILGMLGMLSLTCSLSFPFCLVKSVVVKPRISWIYPNQHLPFSVPAPKREGETPYDLAKKQEGQPPDGDGPFETSSVAAMIR